MPRYSTIFLDLDDTLYPSSNGVWDAIGLRINLFMIDRLAIEASTVAALRDRYFRRYGTTLHGLMLHHDADPHEYMDFVHDVPLEVLLQPNPTLQSMVGRLRQRLIVFTNSSFSHAQRVLHRLGIEDNIEAIVDLFAMGLQHKPQPQAYEIALRTAGESDARACILVDDRVENLHPGSALGMTTVWVGGGPGADRVDHHIDVITDLLAAIPALVED